MKPFIVRDDDLQRLFKVIGNVILRYIASACYPAMAQFNRQHITSG